MESPNNSRRSKGFALVEVLLVTAFVAFVGGMTAFFGMDTFRSYLFHSDKEVLVSALQHARAQAAGNICLGSGCTDGKPHGVKIEPDRFIAFQGHSYAARDSEVDAVFEANPNIAYGGSVTEVVFSQLSATTSGGTITLTDTTGRASMITIGKEGQIVWSN
jgi:Tfp pilus assembly protein FimT